MTRILYIEDEDDLRGLRTHFLRRSGFEVVSVASVAEAKEAFDAQRADVVLTDYNLGHETGLDFVRKLRNEGDMTPVVLLSATELRDIRKDNPDFADLAVTYLAKEASQAIIDMTINRVQRKDRVGSRVGTGESRGL